MLHRYTEQADILSAGLHAYELSPLSLCYFSSQLLTGIAT